MAITSGDGGGWKVTRPETQAVAELKETWDGLFTTQVYLNKSEHICRLVPEGQGWGGGRMGGRRRVRARQSLCGVNQAAGGSR